LLSAYPGDFIETQDRLIDLIENTSVCF